MANITASNLVRTKTTSGGTGNSALPNPNFNPALIFGTSGIILGGVSIAFALDTLLPGQIFSKLSPNSIVQKLVSYILAAALASFVVAGLAIRSKLRSSISPYFLNALESVEESARRRDYEISGPYPEYSAKERLYSRIGISLSIVIAALLYASWIWILDSLSVSLNLPASIGGCIVAIGGLCSVVAGYLGFRRLRGSVAEALRLGKYERAIRLLSLFENFGLQRLTPGRGSVLVQSGRYGEAERWLRGVLLSGSKREQAPELLLYAQAVHGLGDFELAAKFYEHAETFLPHSPYPTIGRAEVMLERHEEPGEALSLLQQAYKRAERRTPDLTAIYFGRTACALDLLRRPESANQALERAFDAIGEDYPPLLSRLIYIKAEILFGRSRVSEAIVTLKQCLALEPHGPISTRAKLLLMAASSSPANDEHSVKSSNSKYRN